MITLDSKAYTVNPNSYDAIPVKATNPGEGFYLITFFLHQPTAIITETIDTVILDEENYKIWAYNFELINKRNVDAKVVNPVFSYQQAKIAISSMTLAPQKVGNYFIVFVNNSSVVKTVDVTINWVSYDISLTLIRTELQERGWNEVWSYLSNATKAKVLPDRQSDACYDLRTALTILLKYICEKLEKTTINFDSGKPSKVGVFKDILLKHGVPNDIVSAIFSTWSLASERVHTERAGGAQPPLLEVIYVYNQVIVAFEYLLSLHLGVY